MWCVSHLYFVIPFSLWNQFFEKAFEELSLKVKTQKAEIKPGGQTYMAQVDEETRLKDVLKLVTREKSQPRSLKGNIVEISCGGQVKLFMRMETPWKVKSFTVGAFFE